MPRRGEDVVYLRLGLEEAVREVGRVLGIGRRPRCSGRICFLRYGLFRRLVLIYSESDGLTEVRGEAGVIEAIRRSLARYVARGALVEEKKALRLLSEKVIELQVLDEAIKRCRVRLLFGAALILVSIALIPFNTTAAAAFLGVGAGMVIAPGTLPPGLGSRLYTPLLYRRYVERRDAVLREICRTLLAIGEREDQFFQALRARCGEAGIYMA